MTINLIQAEGSPFDLHPQLQTIWPEPYNTFAREASAEDSHTGQVQLIMLDNAVVGITGVFSEDDNDDDVFLRWHGVVPGLRHSGIARAAIELLVADVSPLFYPERKRLIELVPHTEYGRTIVEPFFQKVGFVKHGRLERYDWVDHEWQPYALTFK
jgi:hypothetical protein